MKGFLRSPADSRFSSLSLFEMHSNDAKDTKVRQLKTVLEARYCGPRHALDRQDRRVLTQSLTRSTRRRRAATPLRPRTDSGTTRRGGIAACRPSNGARSRSPRTSAIAFEQAVAEALKPWLVLESAERRKPHVPVEARLMRSDPRRPTVYDPRLCT